MKAGLPSGALRSLPQGQFRDVAMPPHDPASALAGGLLESLDSWPGLRLARATGRRTFFGGQLTPQEFTRPPSAVNETYQVHAAIVHSHNARRTLSGHRGRPGVL